MNSTKRSSTKQQPEYTFFTDYDLGRYIVPEALESLGVRVERHHDHFAPHTPDPEWMTAVGTRGWIALSHNKHLSGEEKRAVFRAKLRLFVLIGQRGHPDLADTAKRTFARMIAFLATHAGPFIARVLRPEPVRLKHNPRASGRIVLWAPPW